MHPPAPCLCSAGLREWVSLEGRLPPAEEVVQPKRLVQQIHTEEELLHSRLNTRVSNSTAGAQVSLSHIHPPNPEMCCRSPSFKTIFCIIRVSEGIKL